MHLHPTLRLSLKLAAAAGLAMCASASGARQVVQTNSTIVSATGTTHYIVDGSVGDGAAKWTFQADILARWRQTAKNANLPGWHTASFNFNTMARCVPGRAGAQRNSIRDVVATAAGEASPSDYNGSGSCRVSGAAPKGFFSGSAANDVFLDSRKSGADLVAYVEAQSPHAAVVTPRCSKIKLPYIYDVKRERIKRVGLSLVQKTTNGAKVSLVLLRTVPIVEDGKTVGTVTEKSKITLLLQSGS